MMIYKDKKGFTLTEMLVVLILASITFLIVVPQIQVSQNKNYAKLYKAAFTTIQKVSGELIANTSTKSLIGGYCGNFVNTVNISGAFNCDTASPTSSAGSPIIDNPNFTLNNGIRFYNMEEDMPVVPAFKNIMVDVNGTKGPDSEGKDVLRITVFQNGFVNAPYSPENGYVPACTCLTQAQICAQLKCSSCPSGVTQSGTITPPVTGYGCIPNPNCKNYVCT